MATLSIGTSLGPYEVQDLVGQGGMGEVYRAVDRRLGRTVALKVLTADFAADPLKRQRFEREARMISALSHPHICTLYDIGRQDELEFLVMEYLEGETLDHSVARGPLPVDESVRIALQMAEGLEAAHGRGIVHRDIKPGNVMLTSGGVKLLDFGLALPWLPALFPEHALSSGSDLSLTSEGTLLGTIPYMAPEQLEGKPATASSDVFAFGAVLFELLSGRRAFGGANGAQVIAAILGPERPSLRTITPDVPEYLDRLVSRCLARDPNDRWQTMRDVALELRARPQISNAPPALGRVGARNRRALIVAPVLAALVTAATGAWWMLRPVVDSVAVLPLTNETGDASLDYLSDGITQALINGLSPLEKKLRVMGWSSVAGLRKQVVKPTDVAASLHVKAVVTGSVSVHGDQLTVSVEVVDAQGRQIWGNRYEGARTDAAKLLESIPGAIADRLSVRLTGDDRARLARRYRTTDAALQAYFVGLEHWNRRTPEDLKQSLAYFERSALADTNFALAHAGQANAWALFGTMGYDIRPPNVVFPRAKAEAQVALRLDWQLAEAHAALAFCLRNESKRAEAETEHREAVRLDPNYATGHQWLASHLWTQGKFTEASAELDAALASDPTSFILRFNVGRQFYYQRQYDRAIDVLKDIVARAPSFSMARDQLVLTYLQAGQLESARAAFAPNPTALSMALTGYLAATAGDTGGALEALRKMTVIPATQYMPAYLFAPVYARLGMLDKAMEALNRAYDERSGYLDYIGLEPALDPLRSDPRFRALLQQLNLSTIGVAGGPAHGASPQ